MFFCQSKENVISAQEGVSHRRQGTLLCALPSGTAQAGISRLLHQIKENRITLVAEKTEIVARCFNVALHRDRDKQLEMTSI
jgi:hypothetical protein